VITSTEHASGVSKAKRVAAVGIDSSNTKLALKNAGTHQNRWVPAFFIHLHMKGYRLLTDQAW